MKWRSLAPTMTRIAAQLRIAQAVWYSGIGRTRGCAPTQVDSLRQMGRSKVAGWDNVH